MRSTFSSSSSREGGAGGGVDNPAVLWICVDELGISSELLPSGAVWVQAGFRAADG